MEDNEFPERRAVERWEVDVANYQGYVRATLKNLQQQISKNDAELRGNVVDLYEKINKLHIELTRIQEQHAAMSKQMEETRKKCDDLSHELADKLDKQRDAFQQKLDDMGDDVDGKKDSNDCGSCESDISALREDVDKLKWWAALIGAGAGAVLTGLVQYLPKFVAFVLGVPKP